MAVASGSIKIVRKLLLRGANRHLKNNDEKTPIDIAYNNQY